MPRRFRIIIEAWCEDEPDEPCNAERVRTAVWQALYDLNPPITRGVHTRLKKVVEVKRDAR